MTAEFSRINKTQNSKQYADCLGDFSWKFAYYILNIMCTLKWDFPLLPCVVTKSTRARGTTSLTWRHLQWPPVLSADSSTWKLPCRSRTALLSILQGSRSHCSTCPWCPCSPSRTHFPELQSTTESLRRTDWPEATSFKIQDISYPCKFLHSVHNLSSLFLIPLPSLAFLR